MPTKPKILIVDDRPQNLYLLQRVLQRLEAEIIQADSGAGALALALENDFCVAILDVQMPEMDGYELAELMRGNESTATLPIIFVSAIYSDEYHHRRGYDAGAVDFMSKPFNPDILISKVKVFIDLYNQRSKLQGLVDDLNQANKILSRRAVQLETSNLVGQQVTSILDPDALLAKVVYMIQTHFGYYFAGIWLMNEAGNEITLHVSSKADDMQQPKFTIAVSVEKSLIAHVCRTGQMYLANDVHSDPLYMPWSALSLTHAEIVLPLKMQQEFMGVLDIQNELPFATDDITALQIIADQIAIALRNARLYSQVVRFNEHLEAVVHVRTEELQKAYQTLEKMDKTKSDFITIAAHELRTPLTLIRGYAEMLNGLLGSQPDAMVMVNGILTGQERLFEVVNSMLDVTKIDSQALRVHFEPTRLDWKVQSVVDALEPDLVGRKLEIVVEDMKDLPLVQADPDLMIKLFQHLITNAIKYTPDGGRITICGSMIPPGGLQNDSQEKAVQISICDTGIGINADDQEIIFGKFFQTGPVQLHSTSKTNFKGGGPGLGLAIARGIVNAHGGRIWVESPGYDEKTLPGSTFHVLLPLK